MKQTGEWTTLLYSAYYDYYVGVVIKAYVFVLAKDCYEVVVGGRLQESMYDTLDEAKAVAEAIVAMK